MGAQDPPIDVDGVVDRMRQVVGVKTDIALGGALGMGSSWVSTLRRRGSVPYAECVRLAVDRGASLDWLLLGIGTQATGLLAEVREPDATAYGDPRVSRMVRFIRAWYAGHDSDDVAWLERTLARNVREYAEWLAAQPPTDTQGGKS